jgi:hypothetical protein
VADITVEVSSAGLTAYGASTWGSQSFGGDSVTNVSIGAVDAFYPDEGWGGYYWGYLVWGQNFEDVSVNVTTPIIQSSVGDDTIEGDGRVTLSTNLLNAVAGTVSAQANFISAVTGVNLNSTVNSVFAGENIIVELTTPGTSTTWGQGSFGQYAWNQITGSSADLGEETITAEENITLILSTNLLTLSITSITITADANITATTNLLNTTLGFASENVNANTIVEVSAPGNLPWGATSWGNGSWGNIGGMEVSQGAEEEATPGVEVFVSTNLLTLTLTSIAQITAGANITANTNLLTTSLGNEDAVPNTQVTLSTNLLNVSVGAASGEFTSTVSPTGVSATTSTGRVFIAAWAVVDIGVTNTWSVVDIAA